MKPDARIIELCERGTSSGSFQGKLSASEFHEIANFIFSLSNEHKEAEDICGLCGNMGADKIPHAKHWPGERIPDTWLVHSDCEAEECHRAYLLMTDKQRHDFLKNI